MKFLFSLLLFPLLAVAQPKYGGPITHIAFLSSYSSEQTIATLKKTLEQKGITVFATIDHQAAAKAVGEELSPITLLIVGNPKVGTALMQEEPFMGIELPLKIVVYEQDKKVWVGYKRIAPIVKEYHLEKSKGIAEKIDTTMQQLIRLSIGN